MRRCNEWSIDVQADAYKCGQGAAWVLAALHMSNARITIFFARIAIFGSITIFVAGLQGPRAAMSRRPAIQIPARKLSEDSITTPGAGVEHLGEFAEFPVSRNL